MIKHERSQSNSISLAAKRKAICLSGASRQRCHICHPASHLQRSPSVPFLNNTHCVAVRLYTLHTLYKARKHASRGASMRAPILMAPIYLAPGYVYKHACPRDIEQARLHRATIRKNTRTLPPTLPLGWL